MSWVGHNHTHHIDDDYVITGPSLDGQHRDLFCEKCDKRLHLVVMQD